MASEVTPWRRWQDWATAAAGVLLAISPLWVNLNTRGSWAMVIIGLAMAAFGLIALASPGMVADEWMAVAAGAVAFIAPWVFSFTEYTAAAWTSWIIGVVVVGSALAAVPESREAHRQQLAGHAM
jgi:hypothetical protein